MPRASDWDTEDEWYSSRELRGAARHVRPHLRARDDGFGRRSELLVPERTTVTTGLHRTRSQGHAPVPNVTIYNTAGGARLDNESNPNVRAEQRSPGHSPQPSPRGRALGRMADEWAIEDELAELRLEVARNRRSRSRSAHYHRDESPGYHRHHDHHDHEVDRLKLQMAEERIKEAEERAQQERREELIKERLKLKYLRDKQERDEEEARIQREEDRLKKEWELKMEREERQRVQRAKEAEEERKRIILEEERKAAKKAKEAEEERERILLEAERDRERRNREREAERKRIIAENQLKLEQEEREAAAERQAAVDAYNKKKAEEEAKAKAEHDRIIAEYERNKALNAEQAKRQREELIMQLRIEEEKRKKEEEEEYERFLQKQRKKEQEEKEKKEKHEAELEEAMRKRLAQFGFQDNQIQAMIKPEEQARLQMQQGMTPHNPLAPHNALPRLAPPPTYVKVHKEHLSTDTLIYYDIPYEIDRSDPDYIIILREMDSKETEILFEHTRRLRSRGTSRLLIEERHDRGKPEYAWVRRRNKSRSPSVSRRRTSPKRVVGLREMFL